MSGAWYMDVGRCASVLDHRSKPCFGDDHAGAIGDRLWHKLEAVVVEARDSHEQVAWLRAPTVKGNSANWRPGVAMDEPRPFHLSHQVAQKSRARHEHHVHTIYVRCSRRACPSTSSWRGCLTSLASTSSTTSRAHCCMSARP